MLKRLLGYFAGGCAADESGLQQEEAFLGGLQPEGVLTRRSYAKGKISVICYWEELDMDKIREQLLQDVTDAVDSGEVTSFWQYPDLLLDYDDHAPLREGMEGAPVYIYDESGAHVQCGMDDEDGNVDGKDATPLEAAMIQEEADALATVLELGKKGNGLADGLQPESPPNVSSSAASSSSSPNLLPPDHPVAEALEKMMADDVLDEAYEQYIYDLLEQRPNATPMSKDEFRQMVIMEGMMGGGNPLPADPTKPVNPFAPKPTGPVLPKDPAVVEKLNDLSEEEKIQLDMVLSPSLATILKKISPDASEVIDRFTSKEENVVLPVSVVKNFAVRKYPSSSEQESVQGFVTELSESQSDNTNVPPENMQASNTNPNPNGMMAPEPNTDSEIAPETVAMDEGQTELA